MQAAELIKITSPQRIVRVIEKMCLANMNALIKLNNESSISVKATFTKPVEQILPNSILLTGISQQGLQILTTGSVIKIEVLGMTNKVTFTAKIKRKTLDSIMTGYPTAIVRLERRQNLRLNITPNYMAYLAPSSWRPRPEDIGAPPIIFPYHKISSWCALSDISSGGACVVTHFPAILEEIQSGHIDKKATLILPLMGRSIVEAEVKWVKRIIRRTENQSQNASQFEFRYGIEFRNPDEDLTKKLHQFMRQLSTAGSI